MTRLDWVGAIGLGITVVSGIALVGYTTGQSVLYSWGFTAMSLPTAVSVSATGVSLFLLSRQCERRG